LHRAARSRRPAADSAVGAGRRRLDDRVEVDRRGLVVCFAHAHRLDLVVDAQLSQQRVLNGLSQLGDPLQPPGRGAKQSVPREHGADGLEDRLGLRFAHVRP